MVMKWLSFLAKRRAGHFFWAFGLASRFHTEQAQKKWLLMVSFLVYSANLAGWRNVKRVDSQASGLNTERVYETTPILHAFYGRSATAGFNVILLLFGHSFLLFGPSWTVCVTRLVTELACLRDINVYLN